MLKIAAIVAIRDMAHDRKLFFCLVVALAAVLAPLEVLAGLKYGVVDTLRRRLIENPHIREIVNMTNRGYDDAFIDDLRQRSAEVAFVIPRTRSLAATINLKREDADRIVTADLIPTGPGDPLLAGKDIPSDVREVVLSRSAAEKLALAEGDTAIGTVTRVVDDRRQAKRITLTVVGVSNAFGRDGAFVPLPLLLALEDYRDGYAVAEFGWEGAESRGPRSYAGFRLYARRLEDVTVLSAALRSQNIDVRDHSEDIDFVSLVDRNLTRMLAVVSAIGGGGCLISLAVSLWANIERKRRWFSMLRLLGFSGGAMVAVPVIEAVFVAIFGVVIATVIFRLVAEAINQYYSTGMLGDDPICRLSAAQMASIAAATLVAAFFSALVAGWWTRRVEPAEALFDG